MVHERVLERLRATLASNRELEQSLQAAESLDAMFGGAGRYRDDAIRNRRADIDRNNAAVSEFRRLATQNGVDADAVLLELGGFTEIEK